MRQFTAKKILLQRNICRQNRGKLGANCGIILQFIIKNI